MKALELLYKYKQAEEAFGNSYLIKWIDEAMKELEAYITNYQGIKRRLDNTVTTIAVLQNANSSLIKILEKYDKELIGLKKENREMKSRSCATCKYGRTFHFDKDIECMKLYDATQGLCFEKDFYCKNWESK